MIKAEEISDIIKRQLQGYEAEIDLKEAGRVIEVGDGVARIYGLEKALAGELQKLGAQVHSCARITKLSERIDFIRKEFRALRVKVDEDTVTALLDAVGSDVRSTDSRTCSSLTP